ncbi:hypothetical protein FHR32_005971 [Streptosporangium album]|uniref:Transposase n=1 Tax=Streptosporangium album TaxID=47479 RepID=A0A7W7WCT2_9ACTN|nr:hypothetical protein [Streptosporangium album]
MVENFCLEKVRAALDQREAEKTYGVTGTGLTPVPWSAPALERAWRTEHPKRFAWFAAEGLSSRVPKEACRLRAAGFKNFFDSRNGARKGKKLGFPDWRKRKHRSRFRYDVNERRAVAADAAACGIDVGVKTFATVADDDGTVTEIHAPKPLKAALRRLRKANKAVARKQRGSNNRGLTLNDRVWTCSCGVVHDRDVNAAINLLAAVKLDRPSA